MEVNKKLSASRIATLNMCAQKHYYAYTLGLEKPGESQAQAVGTAVHKAIEEFYDGKHLMPHKTELELGEGATEYNAAVDSFGTFSLLKDGNMSILATEKEFSVPIEDERISNGWQLRGIIDVVAKIDDEIWVGDHKTTRRKWGIEKTSLSLQHKIYELAMQDLYPNDVCAGSFYNFIQLGTSKGVPYANTTRTFLPRNEAGLYTAFEEIISAVKRIESGEVYRNTGDHCQWCEYFTLCQSDYFGGDTQAVIDLSYKVKERK
jgi:RecB family exonuclease